MFGIPWSLSAELQALEDHLVQQWLAIDPDLLSDAELHEATVALEQHRHRMGAVAARVQGRWDARMVWADDGSRSGAARLAREVRCDKTTTRALLGRARKLAAMPATAAALAEGRVSLDHVDLLARVNTPSRASQFAEHEEHLIEQCGRLSFPDAKRLVNYWKHRADAENGDDGKPPIDDIHLHASSTLDGNVVISGLLDPIGGAAFTNELTRLERDLYLADQRAGLERTNPQRRAAALVEMAHRSATAPADGRRPKPLVTVLVGDDSFSHLCELSNGTVITPAQLLPWLDTAMLESSLFDGPSSVVAVSHRRTFTGALRRAIEVRDRHCKHLAECDVPADQCDIDHIVPYRHGGRTSQFNGRAECSTHNRNHDRHDHDAEPLPERAITRLDAIRARLKWHELHTSRPAARPPTETSNR